MAKPNRVAIVGLGNVGASFAYALLFRGLASEIALIDANTSKAEGEAMDLNHTVPFTHSTRIWAGDYSDCAGAVVTVITAGDAQKPGESRSDLVKKNAKIFASIVPQIVQHNPDGILLIATNPVDALTYLAWKLSGLPSGRVIGSGTILDTARFRYLLSQHFDVDARSVHGYIVGEHGDSEVPVWSLTNIAGMRLPEYTKHNNVRCSPEEMDHIFTETRDAAYRIIERKGATYYAIGAGLMRITEAILRDQSTVLSISSLVEGLYGIGDVCLSLPTVLCRGGVQRVIQLELREDEEAKLKNSARVLHETIVKLQ